MGSRVIARVAWSVIEKLCIDGRKDRQIDGWTSRHSDRQTEKQID